MTRSRDEQSAAGVAAQPGTQAVPGDLAAAGRQHRRDAGQARERAAQGRAAAETLLADAQAEATRILTLAETKANAASALAAKAEREAGALEEQARLLDAAAGRVAQAEEAEARAAGLEDERERLQEQAAGLGERLGKLAADRGDLEARLSAALADGDIDTITAVRARITASDELAESLTAQRAAAQARIEAIGDGEMSPLWPQRELADARRIASMHRGDVRRVLNVAYPDRPEAVRDAAKAEFAAVIEAQRSRIAEEDAAQRKKAQRSIVRL